MAKDDILGRIGAVFSGKPVRGELDDPFPSEPVRASDEASGTESSASLMRVLTGDVSEVGDHYFPPELVGGTCPRVAGEEEEIVWNAAAEACDSERIHVVWQSFDNRLWYLAVRSSDLSSQPNSWCPLAAVLPSVKGALPPPVCYTYFGEEVAVLMTVTPDSLQVFRGTGPIVRAKAERTARELGQAPVINIDLDKIERMTPIPWFSASLFEDRARRVLAAVSVSVALVVVGLSFLVWLSASMSMVSAKHDLADAQRETQSKSMEMVRMAENIRTSLLRDQIDKFLTVNDSLLSLNGFLDVYEVKDRKTRWRAVVPPSATADRITAIGGKNIQSGDQGVVIGNDAEIEYEAAKGRK